MWLIVVVIGISIYFNNGGTVTAGWLVVRYMNAAESQMVHDRRYVAEDRRLKDDGPGSMIG